MARTINDVLPILIQIEESFSRLYSNVASIDGQYNQKLKTAASVLSRQETEHAKFYRAILDQQVLEESEVIDERLFSTCKEVLLTFKKSISYESHSNINALLKYAIAYEKKNGDILKELKYILKSVDGAVELKLLLDQLIHAEKEHSTTLEAFLTTN